ncbi:MAG: DUF5677 domain-containing protein [Chloroflexota bacterium]
MSVNDAQLKDVLQEGIASAASALTTALLRDAPRMLAEQRMLRSAFEDRLSARWGKALDLFETILVIAQEAGAAYNQQGRPQAAEERDLVFDVLTRLQARACLTASEVGALLRSGHADAGMSRWRTLHEIAVVAGFIKDRGRDVAERYLLHEVIESLKAAEQYETYHDRLGQDPLEPDQLRQLRAQRDSLIQQFGKEFGGQYGWAATELNSLSPSIEQLERATRLDHMRPYYRMASHGVHPNPKGIAFSLGNRAPQEMMLAGPSNAGLCDPGHATLISLTLCTVTLLTLTPDVQALVTCQALLQLTDAAGQAFLDTHHELKAQEDASHQE